MCDERHQVQDTTESENQQNSENTNNNNNNNLDVEFPNKFLDGLAESKEAKVQIDTPVNASAVQIQSKSEVRSGRNNLSFNDVTHTVMQQHMPLDCDAYGMYGGYIHLYPPVSSEMRQAEFGSRSQLVQRESTKMSKKSLSKMWASSGAYSMYHHEKVRRPAADMHRYPYNPGFHHTDKELCQTSSNPLIAAYQQQNVDIPKTHLQVTFGERKFFLKVVFHFFSCMLFKVLEAGL